MPEEWIAKLTASSQGRRQVLSVSRCMPGCNAAALLKANDVILQVGTTIPVTFRSVLNAVQTLQDPATHEPTAVPVTVLRAGSVLELQVLPSFTTGQETSKLVGFQGLMVQEAPLPVMLVGFTPSTGRRTPYISRWAYGTPSHKHGIRATNWITHVNGKVTATLDEFLTIVRSLKHGDNARFTFEDKQGNTKMGTIKVDIGYSPTGQLSMAADGLWHSTEVDPEAPLDHSEM
jgi:S1-C subfamily serine protease